MFTKLFSFTLMASLLVLAACAPAAASGVTTMQNDGSTTIVQENTGNLSNQAGNAGPAAGAGTETESGQSPSGLSATYTDAIYKFSVAYPSDFLFRTETAEDLAGFNPRPVAGFTFMNPTAASSQVSELADLEIRVYDPAGIATLNGWLSSVGLTASSVAPQPFNASNISGVKLCVSTMIFPNCSYFVMGNGWVYQMRPASQAGESMAQSFGLTQSGSGLSATYTDATYKFSVAYPSDFLFRTETAEDLAGFNPRPVAGFTFMNPTAASSQVSELADLEIRVYDPAGIATLNGWLSSVGLTASSVAPQPFNASNISGVKLCASTMIFPNCSYFVMGNGWVYQMRPASQAGESMAQSFRLTQ